MVGEMTTLLRTPCSSKEMAPAQTEINGRGGNSPGSSAIKKLSPIAGR